MVTKEQIQRATARARAAGLKVLDGYVFYREGRLQTKDGTSLNAYTHKVCYGCAQVLPRNEAHFYKSSVKANNKPFETQCKTCRDTRDRFNTLRQSANKKQLPFALEKQDFEKLIACDCHYCGAPARVEASTPHDVDRIALDCGYTPDNVVSCCQRCKQMKGSLDAHAFIRHCDIIASNFRGTVRRG